MRTYINQYFKGLLYVGAIAYIATFLGKMVMPWFQIEALTIAIILGIVIGNLTRVQPQLLPGIKFALKDLLTAGIVLLGFKLNYEAIVSLGFKMFLVTIGYMVFVFLVVMLLNRWFKIGPKLATLIGVGSSVCGAAAVIAMAPSINADEDDAVIAVSIVSFLGAIGVVVYAGIAATPVLGDLDFGIWSGLTLHGVAHALAGAFARGEVSGEIGTIVKMTRVLMLVPLSVLLSVKFHVKGQSQRPKVPRYVWYFMLMGAINATGWLPVMVTDFAGRLSNTFILLAMTAMGLTVHFKSISGKGAKAILFGGLLFLVTSSVAFWLISWGGF